MEIRNKRGPFLYFEVEKSLEIQNIEINAIDSIMKHFDDPSDCLNSNEQCCQYNEVDNILQKYDEASSFDCTIKYGIAEQCAYLPSNNGLFRFKISDKTHLTSPNQLIINVNIFRINSIIQLGLCVCQSFL